MTKKNQWVIKDLIFFIVFSFLLLFDGATVSAQVDCNQCHGNQVNELKASIHASLSCTSCHSEVTAYPHPEGVEVTKKESVAMCNTCHTGRVAETYQQSFHGKGVFLGSQRAASCVDCHSAHEVLGQDHPNSLVAKKNIPQTCAKCHDNPSPGFAQGTEHFELNAMGPGKPMYYTAKFFVWLTIIAMTLLVIHIELQLYRELRTILQTRNRR
ncbi:class III cytochrome C family protein [Desulfitobacterium dichloroeliminans LMG P-21439]|uniref:Class III cytochrome C family protein n=1 Tax=Desulfitobacterium dichloroeliminans (strain LMG P-21439 / DCA1) TaxID=871963 RepID=L0F8M3_DESDL|nr:cytochrome c3 family protein [Desulfitobacterium dichloroeliminans]AGA70174.1 class III cytochrome C family protein [Desulfitobacterium dichloroeliminans LMG P-21439]